MVYVRTPDNYSGGENCYWHGGKTFDFAEQVYLELQAVMNFQCAH
ncbi:MAG: hypothetical protein QOD77_1275 [Thermoplasmata archaeon]|nr:hypothetical protein [Thermoplasmata archaeon]